MLKKLKSYLLDDIVYIAMLLVLTSVFSFGLGKLSVIQMGGDLPNTSKTATIRSFIGPQASLHTESALSKDPLPTATSSAALRQLVETDVKSQQNFVASKSGTKYHASHCSGSKTIKETNKIFFTTESEAQAAGYTRSANCTFK